MIRIGGFEPLPRLLLLLEGSLELLERRLLCRELLLGGFVGGGALPGQGLPTHVVALAVERPSQLAKALRTGSPAIVPM